MLEGRAKEVTQNYQSVKEMWKCHTTEIRRIRWKVSLCITEVPEGQEKVGERRCLKGCWLRDVWKWCWTRHPQIMKFSKSQIRLGKKKKTRDGNLSLHALQSSFRSPKTKTKRRAREKKWITYEGWNFNQDLFNSNDNRNQKAVDWYFQIAMKKMSSFNSLLSGRKFYNESTNKDVWR